MFKAKNEFMENDQGPDITNGNHRSWHLAGNDENSLFLSLINTAKWP